jgi:hypothetical protein
VGTREAAVFKLEYALEEQQYSIRSGYKKSSSIQAGVCTIGAAVFKLKRHERSSTMQVKVCTS